MSVSIPMGRANPDDTFVDGYMCRVDWECELGAAADGSKVYPSLVALKAEHSPYGACGIVKVRVQFLELVEVGSDNEVEP